MQTNYFKIFNYILNNSPKFELSINKKSFFMKTLIIAVIFFLFLQISFAQDYVPFPMKDAVWNSGHFVASYGFYVSTSYSVYTGGDTLINNLKYTKLYENKYQETENDSNRIISKSYYNDFYIGAIREEDKRVFIYRRNYSKENLLYDFNWKVGDTIVPKTSIIVRFIDKITINDSTKRNHIVAHDFNSLFEIVEGIGVLSSDKIEYFEPFRSFIKQYPRRFECLKINNQIIYGNSLNGNCNYVYTNKDTITDPEVVTDISISKNVIYRPIEIEFPKSQLTIKLFNIIGQLVFSDQSNMSPYTLEKGSLSNGIYFLYCENEQKQSKVFKILVE